MPKKIVVDKFGQKVGYAKDASSLGTEKYELFNNYGQPLGTAKKSDGGAGCIIVGFIITIGFALAPIILGGWLFWGDKYKQPKNLNFYWMMSCFISPLVLPIFGDSWFIGVLLYSYLLMGWVALVIWGRERWNYPFKMEKFKVVLVSILALLWTSPFLLLLLAQAGIVNF